jgi:3-dehydroquinate synthase
VNTIRIDAGQEGYDVFVGGGLLDQLGELCARNGNGARCAVVSDENVAALYGQRILESLSRGAFQPALFTVPAGEQSKTIQSAETICGKMIEHGFDRSSFVVALGGGMVGDLAGFVAAIYHRGISCVQVPTTLLAQVDSSIGGKTGVNTSAGKNLIGAWHQPALVISDVDTLATLPARELRQGFAEIIKHTVIRDAEMFEQLEDSNQADLAALVRRNVEIKGQIVAADEHETTGERALLNFGHTIGHAIERAGEYRDFLHGEAVSLGMVAACEISTRRAGLSDAERQRVVETLERFGLPTRLPSEFRRDGILSVVRLDKKFAGGEVRFVVVPKIGSARVATDVTMADIEEAIEAL